jgi:hypothetical protein
VEIFTASIPSGMQFGVKGGSGVFVKGSLFVGMGELVEVWVGMGDVVKVFVNEGSRGISVITTSLITGLGDWQLTNKKTKKIM